MCGLCATAAGTHALWVFPKYQLSMCRATAEWGADRGCARWLRMYLFKFEQMSVISALHVNSRRVRRGTFEPGLPLEQADTRGSVWA